MFGTIRVNFIANMMSVETVVIRSWRRSARYFHLCLRGGRSQCLHRHAEMR